MVDKSLGGGSYLNLKGRDGQAAAAKKHTSEGGGSKEIKPERVEIGR
jgi:hypothetical protein